MEIVIAESVYPAGARGPSCDAGPGQPGPGGPGLRLAQAECARRAIIIMMMTDMMMMVTVTSLYSATARARRGPRRRANGHLPVP